MAKRNCRKCGTILPPSRYFNCKTCIPTLSSVGEEYIYHSATIEEEPISQMEILTSPSEIGLFNYHDDLEHKI